MVKYIHNSWLATKVAFFHEIYSKLPPEVDYDEVTDILGMFPNIGASHMKAPNEEGLLGYGGACFPKDTRALLFTGLFFKSPFSILSEVVSTNERIKNA